MSYETLNGLGSEHNNIQLLLVFENYRVFPVPANRCAEPRESSQKSLFRKQHKITPSHHEWSRRKTSLLAFALELRLGRSGLEWKRERKIIFLAFSPKNQMKEKKTSSKITSRRSQKASETWTYLDRSLIDGSTQIPASLSSGGFAITSFTRSRSSNVSGKKFSHKFRSISFCSAAAPTISMANPMRNYCYEPRKSHDNASCVSAFDFSSRILRRLACCNHHKFPVITCVGSACCPEKRCEKPVIGAPKGICGVSDVKTMWSQSMTMELDCPLMLTCSIWHLQGRRKAALSSGQDIHPEALTNTIR